MDGFSVDPGGRRRRKRAPRGAYRELPLRRRSTPPPSPRAGRAGAWPGHAGVEGGVMMRISKGGSRYATRELVFLGILPQGSTENQSISGLDFVGVVSKAQDYIAVRGTGFEPLQKDR